MILVDGKKVVTLDSRRRVSLLRVGRKEDTLYEATVDGNGVITLRPVFIFTREK